MQAMTPEFKSIFDLLKTFPSEQDCIEHLEILRWQGDIVSPFDAESTVYRCKGSKYKCKNTGKYFNVRTGTIFDNTKIELQKWFLALYVFSSHKKGISSHQLAKDLDVTQKTAWFLLHRLRYAFNHPNFKEALGGEVEIDETYMGGEEKNKHANKKTKGTQGRSTKTKQPVLGMIQRDGNLIATVVDDTKQKTIVPIINANVIEGSSVYTDEWVAYKNLRIRYAHDVVNHGAKEFVNGMAHTNTMECFWSHMKRGVYGIYHWCSIKHLQAYVDEFSLRFNSRDFTTQQRFDLVLGNINETRLTYKTLISK